MSCSMLVEATSSTIEDDLYTFKEDPESPVAGSPEAVIPGEVIYSGFCAVQLCSEYIAATQASLVALSGEKGAINGEVASNNASF
ncbi:unnamed protein product [Colias eurytheme]|nr:unnamed protein product [Colias eurytheme]